MNEALASLLAAAALVGAPAPRAGMSANTAGETVLLREPLGAIASRQAGAFVARPFGGATLEASAAFDADGDLWIKLRTGSWHAAYSEDALRGGVSADLPAGRARLTLARDVLRVAASSAGSAEFGKMELVDALYASASRLKLDIQEYDALTEDGSSVPASLCLLRRERPGAYFVTSRAPDGMKDTQWFMATGGRLYGMRLDGEQLVFVAKPLPPVPSLLVLEKPLR